MSENRTTPVRGDDLEAAAQPTGGKGNPLLLIVGFIVLGIAAGLLLFGDALLGRNDDTPALLDVPGLTVGDPAINQVPAGAVESLEIGSVAPDFALETPAGEMLRLSDFRGRPVIVNFWATWCAPCRIEMPAFQEAFETYEPDNLVILTLNREESAEQVSAYFDELGLTFPALLDSTAVVADQYRIFNMPTTFFIDKEGVISNIHRGPLTTGQIDENLAELIEG